jgi:hypothetical protein
MAATGNESEADAATVMVGTAVPNTTGVGTALAGAFESVAGETVIALAAGDSVCTEDNGSLVGASVKLGCCVPLFWLLMVGFIVVGFGFGNIVVGIIGFVSVGETGGFFVGDALVLKGSEGEDDGESFLGVFVGDVGDALVLKRREGDDDGESFLGVFVGDALGLKGREGEENGKSVLGIFVGDAVVLEGREGDDDGESDAAELV